MLKNEARFYRRIFWFGINFFQFFSVRLHVVLFAMNEPLN